MARRLLTLSWPWPVASQPRERNKRKKSAGKSPLGPMAHSEHPEPRLPARAASCEKGRAGQTGGCLFGSCVCVPLATTFVVVRRPKAVTPRRCIAGASRPMAALRSFRLRKSVERQETGGWVGGFLAGPVPAPSGADCYTAPQRCLASATRWQRCPLPFSVCLSDGRPHRTLRLRIVTQRLRI